MKPLAQGRACLEYQVAAGSVILELAVQSEWECPLEN